MQFLWQDIVALTLVSLAAGYLALRGWWLFFARRGARGCSGCGGCSGTASPEPSLISLKLPARTGASAHGPMP